MTQANVALTKLLTSLVILFDPCVSESSALLKTTSALAASSVTYPYPASFGVFLSLSYKAYTL